MADKEYIEREVVLKHKRKMNGADWGGEFWDEAVLCEDIRKIPAADVVEVVRCKECKYYRDWGDCTTCVLWTVDWDVPTTSDAFCSFGERKEQW